MSGPERITVADGKYTVINDNGKLSALRNGEPWQRDLIGDNLVYWMMVRILELESVVQANHEYLHTYDSTTYDGSWLCDKNTNVLKGVQQ